MKKIVITASSVLELVAKVYKAEGWEYRLGEVKTRRVGTVYEVRADHVRNRWVATRRDLPPDGPIDDSFNPIERY